MGRTNTFVDQVRSVFQPIVALDSGRLAGFEALARGVAGSPLEQPDRLFEAARTEDRVRELDWACRASAVRGAFAQGFAPPLTLFVNVEPETLGSGVPDEYAALVHRAARELAVVIEVTERALIRDPAQVLQGVDRARALGFGIAVDDVGADASSLALMPFLRPDVIKLDLRLIQAQPSAGVTSIIHAVLAETERTDAVIVAEGIETEEHLSMARALGARYGQGWLFGRPLAVPMHSAGDGVRLPSNDNGSGDVPGTPFTLVRDSPQLRSGSRALLQSFSFYLEQQAHNLWEPSGILSTFQDARFFTPAIARRYSALAQRASFVAALGAGMSLSPAPGVRGATLCSNDPLLQEWTVTVLGPHFAGALIARQEDVREGTNSWAYMATYRRETVLAAMRSLMGRVAPE